MLTTLAGPVGLAAMSGHGPAFGQTVPQRRMSRIIVFDVNETLLDVDALKPHFARAFGDELVLREWFATVLLYSEVASLAGPYFGLRRDRGCCARHDGNKPRCLSVNRRSNTNPQRHAIPPSPSRCA